MITIHIDNKISTNIQYLFGHVYW